MIGIGFAKCGTGSLDFLDCHPSSKLYLLSSLFNKLLFQVTFRTSEPKFFSTDKIVDRIIEKTENFPKPDFMSDVDLRNLQYELKEFREEYMRRVPLAADDEILIEKSPQYSGGGSTEVRIKRAKAMKALNPEVKIIGIACDPVKRAYSQLS